MEESSVKSDTRFLDVEIDDTDKIPDYTCLVSNV